VAEFKEHKTWDITAIFACSNVIDLTTGAPLPGHTVPDAGAADRDASIGHDAASDNAR
jgi:hypothetical protein